MNEARSMSERYSSATESSDLRVRSESRGDVDVLIAAGWIADSFATALYRLRTEFDAVKVDHERAERQLQEQLELARLAQQSDDPKLGAPAAEAIRSQARTDALTARVMVLAHLKTLQRVKDELGAFALGLAYSSPPRIDRRDGKALPRVPRQLDPDQVLTVAGRVLDVFLDPTCHHCEGRGFNGGSHRGEPQELCRPCRGTGNRREHIGQSDVERDFASRLLMRMNMAMAEVDRLMRQHLA